MAQSFPVRWQSGHLGQFCAAWCLISLVTAIGCSGHLGSAGEMTSTDNGRLTANHSLLTPSSQTIDLGIVPQAGREQETFSLTNPTAEPVQIARIESSCDCLEIRLLATEVPPAGKVLAQARLDLSKEPEFIGSLAIQVNGLTGSGVVAFSIVINVSVRPRKEFQSMEDPS